MWDIVKELVTILGGAGILVAALAYLAKTLGTYWMDKDIEKHKAMLQAQNAAAIEQVRSELRRQALEHEVKYRRTDEKIADCLDEVYRGLLHFYKCIENYVRILEHTDEPPKEVKLEDTKKANEEFWGCFLQRRLYIPPALFKKTHAFAKKLTSITNNFTRKLRAEEQGRLKCFGSA